MYGESAFQFIIIEYTTLNNLIVSEQFYLDLLAPYMHNIGYNIEAKANKSVPWNLGKTMSEATKLKMSQSGKGRKKTEAWKQMMREKKLGVPRPQWVKDKVSKGLTGKKASEETKNKMRKSRKKYLEKRLISV